MNFPSFRTAPSRRRSFSTLAAAPEVCESRVLLSSKALKVMGPELPQSSPAPISQFGGPFHGIWYIYLDGSLQGSLTLTQESKEVKSVVNNVFTNQFEGRSNGNKLKISTEIHPVNGEDSTVTWKVSLRDPNHFTGFQTVKSFGSKVKTALDGDTSII
jgi:hypothetical protein